VTRTPWMAALAVLAALIVAAPASAAPVTKTFRSKAITVAPYEVKQANFDLDIPTPGVNGFITQMHTDIVDADGSQVPISRLMLHHIVFLNMGEKIGEKRDGTCNRFTALDSKTSLPNVGERFGGSGEERLRMRLPEGYGYPIKAKDRWAMTYMLMNHRNRTDTAYVQYTVTYDTAPKKSVRPYWLDIKNCLSDPVFDIPGGKKRGSTTRRSKTWTAPETGRIVAGGGHVHGGAKSMTLNRASCELYKSKPTWGRRGHPFYKVKPVLHEPGPVNMSGFTSGEGFPVQRGERLRLDSNYDGELLHTRVMGIMVVFFAKDDTAKPTKTCSRPADLREYRGEPGRAKPPRFIVPLTGLTGSGKARKISAPPGARKRVKSGSVIGVGDRFFTRPNVAVKSGSVLKWRFFGEELHNLTVASGPRGFSSVNLNGNRKFRKKLRTPGTYKLFCGLHPVSMTQTVKVLPKRK
jgi:plastocyanin